VINCPALLAKGPDNLTIPTPPRPWAVAMAAMVSRTVFMLESLYDKNDR
jgi:hypothetical protein